MARVVGITELRRNLSRYLDEVKGGACFTITEQGRAVARLTPAGPADVPSARHVVERGATTPRGDLTQLGPPGGTPVGGPPSAVILDTQRAERR